MPACPPEKAPVSRPRDQDGSLRSGSRVAGAPLNRLANESSPYLLQHKDNPVAWQPWDDTAFAAARAGNKPILLSVGYAACHWCHVMAHESFENEAIAALMNAHFVNIKVDREERPDVDAIYQQALALLGEHGGWPLTMFLTPQGEPFWGGTYFPPTARFGRPGFAQVLETIAEVYAQDPEKVNKNVAALRDGLSRLARATPGTDISLETTDRIAEVLARETDPAHGGIGPAPKFPQCAPLKLLWRAWRRTGTPSYRDAVIRSLTAMCQGGIYDHLGGGFSRYAVDDIWLVPHFEKMLYDNAQLIELLTWAWQETGDPLFAQRTHETVAWVLREMIAGWDATGKTPTGAFASSLDADSEGEEGKFYVWSEAEIESVLGDDAPAFKAAYGVTSGGNWEGKVILNRIGAAGPPSPEEESRLALARARLLARRDTRPRPGWDDKVLADWNGLMICALARAAMAFGEESWLTAAERAFVFVRDHMSREGRLFHAWRHGVAKHAGLLDDYAHMSAAALALAEATGNASYVEQAQEWVACLDRVFWDASEGGYFTNAADGERLIVRAKSAADTATPSGNGIMAEVLARLYYLTGETRFRARAEALISAFAGEVERNFFPLATLINGNELLHRAVQVVIIGERGEAGMQSLLGAVHTSCVPNLVLLTTAPQHALAENHPAHGKGPVDGRATAYVCHGTTCSLPLTEWKELKALLTGGHDT